jgi:hypothetical protein
MSYKAKKIGEIDVSKFMETVQPRRNPHLTRKVFKRFDVRINAIADVLDVAPCTISQVLNGNHRPSKNLDLSLKCLASYLLLFGRRDLFDNDFKITGQAMKK